MNHARRVEAIVDALLSGETAAPAPVAPPRPATKPATPSTPARPRPGTRPWNPSVRPGVNPRPKARGSRHGWVNDEMSFAESRANTFLPRPGTRPNRRIGEADGSISVPPAANNENPKSKPEPVPLKPALSSKHRKIARNTGYRR